MLDSIGWYNVIRDINKKVSGVFNFQVFFKYSKENLFFLSKIKPTFLIIR